MTGYWVKYDAPTDSLSVWEGSRFSFERDKDGDLLGDLPPNGAYWHESEQDLDSVYAERMAHHAR